MTDQQVLDAISACHQELTEIRRDIHAHPELGRHETRTAALVATKLRDWGIETSEGVGGTGVVGTIRGVRPGSGSIGLRADMDALALKETTGLPYASRHDGFMHACGHDGHTAMLLGAARVLAANPDFAGTVHLIFQPAEEGRGGGPAMIDDGLFDRFGCDAVYGLHGTPSLAAGMIGTATGPLMAGSGRFDVTFSGVGGHGGMAPHQATDLSVVQAHFVLALQTVVGRNVPPGETAVISVGHLAAGSADALNVMPAQLRVGGTMRCFTKQTQDLLAMRVTELASAFAGAHGATAEVRVWWTSPPLINPREQAEIVVRAAQATVGAERTVADLAPVTGGEDFAFMMEARPGAFAFLGNGTPHGGVAHMLHTPDYDFNDEVIPVGVAYWHTLVHRQLR